MNKIVRSVARKKNEATLQKLYTILDTLQNFSIHDGCLSNSIHDHPVSDEYFFHGANFLGETDPKKLILQVVA